MGPPSAVAEIRRAVRRVLTGLGPGDLVLAACSGGADSLALAAALAFEAPRRGMRAGGVTVDHGLQAGSAAQAGAAAILLGHTMDDQAETVLLGLARGSGARSLAGMAVRNGRFLRPLLAVSREQTAAACAALGLSAWQDPQNTDPSFAR